MYLGCHLLQKPVEFSAGIKNLQKHIKQLTFKDLPTEERAENLFFTDSVKERRGINWWRGLFGISDAKPHGLEWDIVKPKPFCFHEKNPTVFFC